MYSRVERESGSESSAPPCEPNGRSSLDPLVLHQRLGNLEGVDDRMQRRIADGEPADRSRGGQVVLEQRRRHRQDAGDVVEAFLIGFVRRQQGAAIDLEAEQIADGVGVLAAVQAMDGDAAWIRMRRRRRIELALQRRRDGA